MLIPLILASAMCIAFGFWIGVCIETTEKRPIVPICMTILFGILAFLMLRVIWKYIVLGVG